MKAEIAQQILKRSRESYDKIAGEFSASRAEFWPELTFIADHLPQEGSVLDIGCGNGRLLRLIGDLPLEYVGVDSSEKLLDEARRLFPTQKFIAADALALPFADQTFDAAVSLAVLHHIPSAEMRQKFFNEAARVLKPGGTLIVTVWNFWRYDSWRQLWQSLVVKIRDPKLDWGDLFLGFGQNKDRRYFHILAKKELANLAAGAGFEIETLRTVTNSRRNRSNILLIAAKK